MPFSKYPRRREGDATPRSCRHIITAQKSLDLIEDDSELSAHASRADTKPDDLQDHLNGMSVSSSSTSPGNRTRKELGPSNVGTIRLGGTKNSKAQPLKLVQHLYGEIGSKDFNFSKLPPRLQEAMIDRLTLDFSKVEPSFLFLLSSIFG